MGYKQPGFSKHATKDEINKTKVATTSVKKPITPKVKPTLGGYTGDKNYGDDPISQGMLKKDKAAHDVYTKKQKKRTKDEIAKGYRTKDGNPTSLTPKKPSSQKRVPKNKRILRNKNE